MTDAQPNRQCQHIKANGERCKKNALPGRSYCNMASHRRAMLWRTKIKNFGRKWWPLITTIFALVVGVPALYSYSTRLSVTPSGTIQPREPMGTIFNVTNNGISDLHNVAQECDLIMVKSDDANEIGPNKTRPKDFMLGDLPAGATKSLSCEQIVRGFNREASIEIVITYDAPLWHRPGIKRFPFRSKQADDGTWVWKAT